MLFLSGDAVDGRNIVFNVEHVTHLVPMKQKIQDEPRRCRIHFVSGEFIEVEGEPEEFMEVLKVLDSHDEESGY